MQDNGFLKNLDISSTFDLLKGIVLLLDYLIDLSSTSNDFIGCRVYLVIEDWESVYDVFHIRKILSIPFPVSAYELYVVEKVFRTCCLVLCSVQLGDYLLDVLV